MVNSLLRVTPLLVPACAGVILAEVGHLQNLSTCPRVCGGDPSMIVHFQRQRPLSPRVRG